MHIEENKNSKSLAMLRVIMIEVSFSKCSKKRTDGQTEYIFNLSVLEERRNSMAKEIRF